MFLLLSVYTWLEIICCYSIFIIIQIPLFLVSLIFDRRRRLLHYHTSLWTRLSFFLTPLFSLSIEGAENLDRKKPFVVVMNHQSLLDIMLVYSIFLPVRMVAKKVLALVPIIGWNLFMCGHMLVNRKSVKSQFGVIRRMETLVKSGNSILIFPEGTRTSDGNISKFRKGAFRTASATGTDILPVVIDGAFQALPKKGFAPDHFQKLRVKILPPVSVTEGEDVNALSDKCRNLMVRTLENMRDTED